MRRERNKIFYLRVVEINWMPWTERAERRNQARPIISSMHNDDNIFYEKHKLRHICIFIGEKERAASHVYISWDEEKKTPRR